MKVLVIATISAHNQDKLDDLTNQACRWDIESAAKLVFLATTTEDEESYFKLAVSFKSNNASRQFIEEYQSQEAGSEHNVQFENLDLLKTPKIDALGVLF